MTPKKQKPKKKVAPKAKPKPKPKPKAKPKAAAKPVKKVVAVKAKAVAKVAAKPVVKTAKPDGKSKVAAKMLVAVDKKANKAMKKDWGKRQEYTFDVEQAILPQLTGFKISSHERMPLSLKDTKGDLAPRMISAGRVFLTDDDSIEKIRSLIDVQILSYKWFLTEGLAELLKEISPITDFSGKKMELNFLGHTFDAPKYDPATCRRRNLSYEAAMKAYVQLINKETGEIKEQDVFLGSIPLMTDSGTFIVGGIERVVVTSSSARRACSSRPCLTSPSTTPQRSSRSAVSGWKSRPTAVESSPAKSTASAKSRSRSCCASSVTRTIPISSIYSRTR